eukprot:4652694-Pyramimonas_sp.AAC.1
MSTISEKFANMLSAALDKAPLCTCSLVFYGDEMTPGNPLRSDVGRQLWNFLIHLSGATRLAPP